MTSVLVAVVTAVQALTVTQPVPARPVIVVEDPQEVRRVVHIRVDGTFTPTQEEAEAPRRELARFLESEIRGEANRQRRDHLNAISLAQDQYVWHCGGYKRRRQKFLFCSFVRREPSRQLLEKAFPVVKDGGISACYCHFNLNAGRVVRLGWNGDA